MFPRFFFNADAGGGTGGAGGGEGGSGSAAGGGTLLAGAGGQQGGTGGAGGTPPAWSWADEGGTFSPGWQEKLGPELGANPSLKAIGSVSDLAKSYVETKKLMGTKLEAPGENATPEQVASWRKTVGAPDKPEGYLPEGVKSLRPEGVPEQFWNADAEKGFLALAHKHHLTPAAVKDILGFHGEHTVNAVKASEQDFEQTKAAEMQTLKTEFGGDFQARLALAERVAVTVGLDPHKDPLFNSAAAVIAFSKMGKLLSESSLVKGDAQGVNGSIASKAAEITDPQSTSQISREYRGEFGPERQAAAQRQYHDLLKAQG